MKAINILIVEDDPMEALMLKELLSEVGYSNIMMVSSGEKAISHAKDHPVDLTLMDIKLSGTLDGVQTAVSLEKICSTHIIYMTSLRDRETFVRAKETFPELFLSKPYNKYQLLDCIQSIIDGNISKNHLFEDYFFAKKKHDNTYFKISKKDIVFLKADNSYTLLHTTAQENLVVTKNLKHSLTILNESYFVRISRSVTINIHHLKALKDSQYVVMGDGKKTFAISQSYKKDFLRLVNEIKL